MSGHLDKIVAELKAAREIGVDAITATNGQEAVALVEHSRPDLGHTIAAPERPGRRQTDQGEPWIGRISQSWF